MKKTILSLALATIAVSALADISLYQSNYANIYVTSSLAADANGSSTSTNTTVASKSETNTTKKGLDSSINFTLGTGADVGDSEGFNGGYYFELSKDLLTTTDGKRDKFTALSTDDISAAYGYLADNVLGKLVYGKTDPISLIGADNNGSLDLDDQTVLFENASVDNPYTVAYYTPVNGGIQFAYSFSNNYADGAYQRQNVWQFTYEHESKGYGVFNASLGASFYKGYTDSNNVLRPLSINTKANQFQISAGVSDLAPNLNVTLVYSLGIQKGFADFNGAAILDDNRSLTRSLLLKTDYSLNQYFNPYAGFGYVQTYNVKAGNTYAAELGQTFQGYVGVSSTLYSLENVVSVKAYAEVADKFTTTHNANEDKSKDSVKTNVFSYAFGASLEF